MDSLSIAFPYPSSNACSCAVCASRPFGAKTQSGLSRRALATPCFQTFSTFAQGLKKYPSSGVDERVKPAIIIGCR